MQSVPFWLRLPKHTRYKTSTPSSSGTGPLKVSYLVLTSSLRLSGIYSVTGFGLNDPGNEGMKIVAMGDIDNDNSQDIVTLNSQQDQITVHYFDSDQMKYIASNTFGVDPSNPHAEVASIVISKDMRNL